MKVAITSSGNSMDSLIDQRFGRCAFFAVYDTDTKETLFLENTARNADSGAGPAAVAIVAQQEVEKVVSGEFGFKIKSMLDDLRIQMVMVKEDKTVGEIIGLLA